MNKTIFDNIMYAYNLEFFSVEFRPERIYSAIDHFDYFVKPGEDTTDFLREFEIAFQQGEDYVRKSQEVSALVDFPFSLEHSRWVWIALSLVRLVKEFLDKDYLNSMIKVRSNCSYNTTPAFSSYMKKIDANKLATYEWIREYPNRRLEEFAPVNLLKC